MDRLIPLLKTKEPERKGDCKGVSRHRGKVISLPGRGVRPDLKGQRAKPYVCSNCAKKKPHLFGWGSSSYRRFDFFGTNAARKTAMMRIK